MVSIKAILLGATTVATASMTDTYAFESDWKELQGTGLVQLSFDGKSMCGVNAGNQVFCATRGLSTSPEWRVLEGALKWVAVWGDTLWGVNSADEVWCGKTTTVGGNPNWRKLPGSLKQISSDGKQICGADANNDIWCADDLITENPNWRKLPGKLKQVDVTDGVIYGAAPDDTIWFGFSEGEPSWTKLPGGLKQVAFDGSMLCGVASNAELWCADDGLRTSPNWRHIPGSFVQVDVEAGRAYAVGLDQQVSLRWFTPPPAAMDGWQQLTSYPKLRQISFDGKTLCGVDASDGIWCATSGFDSAPNWRQLDGSLTHVVVWGDALFGVNREGNIWTGRAQGAPGWRLLPGNLQQVSTDGKQLCGTYTSRSEIWCADSLIDSNPNWRHVSGGLKHVVVLNGVLLGTSAVDDFVWLGRSEGEPKWLQLAGGLRNLEYDGVHVCGTSSIDEIFCADSGLLQGKPNWKKIDGKAAYVTVNAGRLFAVNSNAELFTRSDL